jgi:hypothetical protein
MFESVVKFPSTIALWYGRFWPHHHRSQHLLYRPQAATSCLYSEFLAGHHNTPLHLFEIIHGCWCVGALLHRRGFTSLMLHSLTVQSSLPLANFVGHTGEKSTDQALFSCSLYWENSWPVLASHNWKYIELYMPWIKLVIRAFQLPINSYILSEHPHPPNIAFPMFQLILVEKRVFTIMWIDALLNLSKQMMITALYFDAKLSCHAQA